MIKLTDVMDVKKLGIFAAGVLFGTAGIKVLTSRDAKEKYVKWTAAALRAKECVLDTAASIQDNAEDILAEAKQLNEERAADEAMNDFETLEEEAVEVEE